MDDSNERYVHKLNQASVADRGEAKTPTQAEADADQLPPVSGAAPPSGPPGIRPADPIDCGPTRRSDVGFCDEHFHLKRYLADGGQPKSKPCLPWSTRRAAAMRHLHHWQRVPVRPSLLDRGFRVSS